ncbi:hypothetical protein GCM10009836_18720 [Pseudonocardia ailaonensis]|uniref:Radical SAM core domain-containing protein n=1 Tax=Pseudonocardia ailaonensis TaxID=367279 RepID=A0ABN2MV75_9PSEU
MTLARAKRDLDPSVEGSAPAVLTEDAIRASARLRVSLTSKCNFRCFFCHNEGQSEDEGPSLSIADYGRIANACSLAGIDRVKLTGGEPLIYKSGQSTIVDLVRTFREAYGRNSLDLSITSNGWHLSKYVEQLADAGLNRATISLSSLDRATHSNLIQGREGSPSLILQNIEKAVAANLSPVKVNTVIFADGVTGPGNLTELPEIIRRTRDVGVSELRVYPIINYTQKLRQHSSERYQYWDREVVELISSGIEQCAGVADVDQARNILSGVVDGDFDSIAASSRFTLFIPAGEGFRIALNMMSAFRTTDGGCSACRDPQSCQEGMYSLRLSTGGDFRACLNADPYASLSELASGTMTDSDLNETVAAAREEFVRQHQTGLTIARGA